MEEENNSEQHNQNAEDWITGKDKIKTFKKYFLYLMVIIILVSSSFSYTYLTYKSDNTNAELTLEISIEQKDTGLYVHYYVNNTGWRPVDVESPIGRSRESIYYELSIVDSNGNRIEEINYINSSLTTKIDGGDSEWEMYILSNYNHPISDSASYNVTNTTGPYIIQLIYDSTTSNSDVWKGVIESNTVVLDDLP